MNIGDRKQILGIPHVVVQCAKCRELMWVFDGRPQRRLCDECEGVVRSPPDRGYVIEERDSY